MVTHPVSGPLRTPDLPPDTPILEHSLLSFPWGSRFCHDVPGEISELYKTKFCCRCSRKMIFKKFKKGVPVVAQRLTNPTRSHKVLGSIPGLAPWVKDPELP